MVGNDNEVGGSLFFVFGNSNKSYHKLNQSILPISGSIADYSLYPNFTFGSLNSELGFSNVSFSSNSTISGVGSIVLSNSVDIIGIDKRARAEDDELILSFGENFVKSGSENKVHWLNFCQGSKNEILSAGFRRSDSGSDYNEDYSRTHSGVFFLGSGGKSQSSNSILESESHVQDGFSSFFEVEGYAEVDLKSGIVNNAGSFLNLPIITSQDGGVVSVENESIMFPDDSVVNFTAKFEITSTQDRFLDGDRGSPVSAAFSVDGFIDTGRDSFYEDPTYELSGPQKISDCLRFDNGGYTPSLLNNGSFQSGDTSGWIRGGDPSQPAVREGSYFNLLPTHGSHHLQFQGDGGGYIYQTFATVIGNKYDLSFALASIGQSEGVAALVTVTSAGGELGDLFDGEFRDPKLISYTYHQASFVATASSATLRFEDTSVGTGRDPMIDNISIRESGGKIYHYNSPVSPDRNNHSDMWGNRNSQEFSESSGKINTTKQQNNHGSAFLPALQYLRREGSLSSENLSHYDGKEASNRMVIGLDLKNTSELDSPSLQEGDETFICKVTISGLILSSSKEVEKQEPRKRQFKNNTIYIFSNNSNIVTDGIFLRNVTIHAPFEDYGEGPFELKTYPSWKLDDRIILRGDKTFQMYGYKPRWRDDPWSGWAPGGRRRYTEEPFGIPEDGNKRALVYHGDTFDILLANKLGGMSVSLTLQLHNLNGELIKRIN